MSEARTGRMAEDAKAVGERLGPTVSAAVDRVAKSGDLGTVKDEIKDVAGDLTGAAVEQGKQFYESAKAQASGFADERKNAAAQSVADLAASLRSTGETFGERPNIQAFVGSAAEGLEQLATSIQDRSFAELFADAEAYARRSPVTVGAAAALAGFLLARFIKSSADEMAEANHVGRSQSAQAGSSARGGGRKTAARRPATASLDV